MKLLPGPLKSVEHGKAGGSRLSSNPRPAIIGGLMVILVTFVGFGTWAALVPLDRGAHVVGRVILAGDRKTISHLEGGVIKEIRVHEGDRVKEGDVLIRMDETPALANREVNINRRIQDLVLEARLTSERDGAPRIVWPKEITPYMNDPRLRAAMAGQETYFQSRKRELEGKTHSLSERNVSLRRQMEAIAQKLAAIREQHRLVSTTVQAHAKLVEQGFATQDRLRELERSAAGLQAEQAAALVESASVQTAIQDGELQIVQLRREFARGVDSDLQDVRARLAEVSELITAAEGVAARTTIRAPVSGQVVGLGVHTIGGVIRPGEPILFVVPDTDRLLLEAHVKPEDADVVHQGLPAEVRFSGLPRRAAPLLNGHVLSVATDTLTDPVTKETYYLARIEVKDEELEKLKRWVVVPGMPVEILVSAGKRTLLDYMIAPIEDLFMRAMRED